MATVETDIKTTEPTAEQLTAAKAELNKNLEKRKKTAGEKIYDRSVYTGVGWGVNEVASMGFTGMFERGENRLLGWRRFAQWENAIVKKWKWKHSTAQDFLMWASLNTVGCLVVPAIKLIDGHKASLVKKLNHQFGSSGMTDEQIAARDKEVETAIACEPTQSWKTLIIGRLAAMAAAIGNGTFILGYKRGPKPAEGEPDLRMSGNKYLKRWFDQSASFAGRGVGLKAASVTPHNFQSNAQPHPRDMNAFHYYSGLAGPETVGCLVTSVVLEGVSKHAAKKDPHIRDQEICNEEIRKIIRKKAIEQPADSHVQQIASEEAAVGPRAL